MWPTMKTLRGVRRVHHPLAVLTRDAIGFSQKTCLPASSGASAAPRAGPTSSRAHRSSSGRPASRCSRCRWGRRSTSTSELRRCAHRVEPIFGIESIASQCFSPNHPRPITPCLTRSISDPPTSLNVTICAESAAPARRRILRHAGGTALLQGREPANLHRGSAYMSRAPHRAGPSTTATQPGGELSDEISKGGRRFRAASTPRPDQMPVSSSSAPREAV